MSVTQIDIDDDALERVMALSRAKTKKEAVKDRFVALQEEKAALERELESLKKNAPPALEYANGAQEGGVV